MLGAVSVSAPVAAEQMFELVGGTMGMGGFNARATGASPASTFFNPALLPQAKQELQFGTFAMRLDYRIESLPRPNCEREPCSADIRQDIAEINAPGDFDGTRSEYFSDAPPIATSWLEGGKPGGLSARPRNGASPEAETVLFHSIGMVKRVLDEKLVYGFYAMVPADGPFIHNNSFFSDEREQYFENSLQPELFSDRTRSSSLAFGFGSEFMKGLSVGASFTLSVMNQSQAQSYVPNGVDLTKQQVNVEYTAVSNLVPHLGVAYQWGASLGLTATYHGVQKFEIQSGFANMLNSGESQDSAESFVFGYIPRSVSVGAAYELTEAIGAVASAQWSQWSQYLDRHAHNPVDIPAEGEKAWSDTVSLTGGGRWQADDFAVFVDATYVPSAVPGQPGRKNYVDNDRAGVATGGSCPFSLWGANFTVGAQLQVQFLLAREVRKVDFLVRDEVPDDAEGRSGISAVPYDGAPGLQTNNPGWPGYNTDGVLIGAGAHIGLAF